MDFKFVLPIIYINIKGKIQLEVNWTQIDHFGPQKTIKVAISQFAFLRKTRLLKTLRLLHFSIFFYEIFRINVELNFALNLLLGFSLIFQKKYSGRTLKFGLFVCPFACQFVCLYATSLMTVYIYRQL